MVIGAQDHTTGDGFNAGTVYLHRLNESKWTQFADLTGSGVAAGEVLRCAQERYARGGRSRPASAAGSQPPLPRGRSIRLLRELIEIGSWGTQILRRVGARCSASTPSVFCPWKGRLSLSVLQAEG